jgi:hypothetical protein
MRRYREDDRESAGFELVGFLCAVIASAIAFFVYSGNTDEIARVQFIDPVHAGAASGGDADNAATSSIPPGSFTLPATAPRPGERPPHQATVR